MLGEVINIEVGRVVADVEESRAEIEEVDCEELNTTEELVFDCVDQRLVVVVVAQMFGVGIEGPK
jgi:hypothetical protein